MDFAFYSDTSCLKSIRMNKLVLHNLFKAIIYLSLNDFSRTRLVLRRIIYWVAKFSVDFAVGVGPVCRGTEVEKHWTNRKKLQSGNGFTTFGEATN